jgi:intracellular septation protein A
MEFEFDFCSCITSHIYFKILFVLVFGILITFAHEVEFLRNKISLYIILVILLMMSFTHTDEPGSIIFLLILFILAYNIKLNHKNNNDNNNQ